MCASNTQSTSSFAVPNLIAPHQTSLSSKHQCLTLFAARLAHFCYVCGRAAIGVPWFLGSEPYVMSWITPANQIQLECNFNVANQYSIVVTWFGDKCRKRAYSCWLLNDSYCIWVFELWKFKKIYMWYLHYNHSVLINYETWSIQVVDIPQSF